MKRPNNDGMTDAEFVAEVSEDLQRIQEAELEAEILANATAEYEKWLEEQSNPDF